MKQLPRKPLTRTGFIGGVAVGLVLGLAGAAATPGRALDADDAYRKLRIFSQVFNYVENNYVEPVKNEDLVYGAIRGMLSQLDPHTAFLPREMYQKMKEDTTGEFAGLGIEIGVKEGWLTIIAPLKGSPADHAGLRAGDRILAIADQDAEGMSIPDAVALLRGPPNTKVTLTVMRMGWEEPRAVALVRKKLRMNPVDHRTLEPGYGYVYIKSFQERTERYLKRALDKLRHEARLAGFEQMRGLVLDLRDNPGGLVDEAVRVSDLFLDSGDVVTTVGRHRRHVDRQRAHRKGTEPPYPLIVLVNEGSASASEIVAGALQDHKRALVMGQPSYGKGSVQTIIELEDGSGLKLTVARYYTPSGRSIQDHGITPDVLVEPIDVNAPIVDLEQEAPADHQLKTALDYLKAWDVFGRGLPGDRDVSTR